MMIDTHAHIADDAYDKDRDAVIARAQEAGVAVLVEIAESPDMWESAVQLADTYPFIYASLGIHPHHAQHVGPSEWPLLSNRLRSLLRHPKVVAVGEFGLDYYRMQNTKEQQDYLFRQQLALAMEADKPVVIHCRDDNPKPMPMDGAEGAVDGRAHTDVQAALSEFFPMTSLAYDCPRPVGVIHCFSGNWTDAQSYMRHGFVLGVDGPVTYPSSKLLKENVQRMPLPRMVVETDAPYLPPQAHRGERNEPSYLPAVLEAISVLKRKSIPEVSDMTTRNAKNLFRLRE